MTQVPTQRTLPDFIRTLRAHRVLFVLVVVAAIASALVYSFSQEKTYEAEASLEFRDQTRDLGLVGAQVAPTQTANQLAAANAQTVVQPNVAARVKRDLRSPLSVSQLSDAVTATVETDSNLVKVRSEASTAEGAQKLANEFARQGAKAANRLARRDFAAAARALEKERPKRLNPTAKAIYTEQLSRLRALSTIANPAQVASLADKPSEPASPKPVRNALLGAVLGLVLGLLAVFVRDSFDRRLRSAAEIQAEFSMPLLGHVGDEVLGRTARPDARNGVTATDWELFRILRRNLDFVGESQESRLVAVTSALPEEGKTTVASFLAIASAAAGKRTLLVECDLRKPVLAERLGLADAPGLTDFVSGDAEPTDILQTVSFKELGSINSAGPNGGAARKPAHTHQLVCITAGTRSEDPVEILRSERFRSMLSEVRAAYDLVLLDTTPLLVVVDVLELLPEVDTIVMCVRETQTTRAQARAGKAALERLPERPAGLVITGMRPGEEEYGYYGYYA